MLICVDGTGPLSDRKYKSEFAESFVHSIHRSSRIQPSHYWRGPELTGTGLDFAYPQELFRVIGRNWIAGDHRILMAGYSRGAAIVASTAELLSKYPMPDGRLAEVEALFLFDAVAMSAEVTGSPKLPPNVRHCYHAVRSDAARSRTWWGHCATEADKSTNFRLRHFLTTHGGMGGVPNGAAALHPTVERLEARFTSTFAAMSATQVHKIPTVPHVFEVGSAVPTAVTKAQELRGSREVRDWMWHHLRSHHAVT